jgi:hypothetical protein
MKEKEHRWEGNSHMYDKKNPGCQHVVVVEDHNLSSLSIQGKQFFGMSSKFKRS